MVKEWLKDKFAYFYKRYTWGYGFMSQGVSLFNFVGILSIVLGTLIRSYIFIPLFMLGAIIISVIVGWLMFDKFRFKTKFTEQEGNRDDYWHGKLTPNQIRAYTMLLDCIENPKKVKIYRARVKKGRID